MGWLDIPHYGVMWQQLGRDGGPCRAFANNSAGYCLGYASF